MGLGCPHVNLLDQQPFRFDHSRGSPIRDASGHGGSDCQTISMSDPKRLRLHSRHWRDQRPLSPCFPLPTPDHVGLRATGTCYQWLPQYHPDPIDPDGSQHSQRGRQHQEDRACMKINFPVFKDEDSKDAVNLSDLDAGI